MNVAAENVATGNRQPKKPNSRQRRSKRRLETFIARKRASNDTEAADGPSSRDAGERAASETRPQERSG